MNSTDALPYVDIVKFTNQSALKNSDKIVSIHLPKHVTKFFRF